jgi:hypothetical protein
MNQKKMFYEEQKPPAVLLEENPIEIFEEEKEPQKVQTEDSLLEKMVNNFNLKVKLPLVFILPQTDNSGKDFSEELFGWIDRALCDLGGGFHYHPVSGGWVNNKGVVQCENCRKYHVGISETDVPKLFTLLVQAKNVFYQEVLYIEFLNCVLFLS